MNIKISADSTCDLPQELIRQYDIGITPLYITIEDQVARDMLEISSEEIFRAVDSGKACRTSAVNLQDYLDSFSGWLSDHDAVIHFTISSDMSSCYQNACVAAAELGNVYVIDSRSLSTGIGLLVLEAAELSAQGMEPAAVVEVIEQLKEKIDASFVLDTLEYLHRGGRCSTIATLGANLLKLRPSIQVKDGVMTVSRKFRGSLDRCFADYIKDKLSDPDTIDTRCIFITYAGLPDETVERVIALIRSLVPFEAIYHSKAGCTVSSHCGPGCMGILFFRK